MIANADCLIHHDTFNSRDLTYKARFDTTSRGAGVEVRRTGNEVGRVGEINRSIDERGHVLESNGTHGIEDGR